MTGSPATGRDVGGAMEGRVSSLRLVRVVKAESSEVGAVEMRLVVKAEQAVVGVVNVWAGLMVIVEVDHGGLAVVGVVKVGASSMVEVKAVVEAKEGGMVGRPEVVVVVVGVVKVAVVLLLKGLRRGTTMVGHKFRRVA